MKQYRDIKKYHTTNFNDPKCFFSVKLNAYNLNLNCLFFLCWPDSADARQSVDQDGRK